MSEATIVALVILIGVFVLMAITIWKAGTDAAIKLWGVMGALTGVAFGAITSYYFTSKISENTVAEVRTENKRLQTALTTVTTSASKAHTLVSPVYAALQGDNKAAAAIFPPGVECVSAMLTSYRVNLTS